jgi:hypothetical protein
MTIMDLDIEQRLHSLICGRKRRNINRFMLETGCKVYLPSVWWQLQIKSKTPESHKKRSTSLVHIVGPSDLVTQAAQRLESLAQLKVIFYFKFIHCS